DRSHKLTSCLLKVIEIDDLPIGPVTEAIEESRVDGVSDCPYRTVAEHSVDPSRMGAAEFIATSRPGRVRYWGQHRVTNHVGIEAVGPTHIVSPASGLIGAVIDPLVAEHHRV